MLVVLKRIGEGFRTGEAGVTAMVVIVQEAVFQERDFIRAGEGALGAG